MIGASGAGADTVHLADGVLIVERWALPMTLNSAIGARGKASFAVDGEIRKWRRWAKATAERDIPGVQLTGPFTVTVVQHRRTRASIPDVGAPILAVKALIDGLVEALVLPADTPEIIARLTFEAPRVVGWHGLHLTITPVPADDVPADHPTRQETLL